MVPHWGSNMADNFTGTSQLTAIPDGDIVFSGDDLCLFLLAPQRH